MLEWVVFPLFAFIAGSVATWFLLRDENEEEIKMIEPPLVIREEKRIVIANAEFAVPDEDMPYPVSSKWIEGELSHKLAEQIWKYAMVSMTVDKRNLCHIYRANLQVVDNGQLNPFCSYGERRTDNER